MAVGGVLVLLLIGGAFVLRGPRARNRGPEHRVAAVETASAQATATPPEPPADPTPEVRGRVLDSEGSPVAGAAVRLLASAPPSAVLRESRSDGTGDFDFTRVGPGAVRVVADHEPEGTVTSAELHATAGRTVEVTLVLVAAPAVRGTVVDDDEHPVAGAAISLEGAPGVARSATSDDSGAFRLAAVPDEATAVVAVARGFRTGRADLPARSGAAEIVVRVRLSAASPVAGDVQDADGNPVHARVVACEGQPAEVRVESGDDGTFELPAAAIGCSAMAEHDEYGASDGVAVVEGRRLGLRLRPGGSVEGVAVDERGAPVPAYAIGLESFIATRGLHVRSGGQRRVEDPGGAFRWDKLAPGTYVFSAIAPGRAPARSVPVDVRSGAATRGVRILLARGAAVVGHVYDDHHAPLAGVDLRFDAVSSAVESTSAARSDAAGAYRLEGAPSGPFTVRAQKDGFRVRFVSGLRADAGGTLPLDVTLTPVAGGPGTEYGGIGASLQPTGQGVAFGGVFPGDAAERAGLRGGDRIVAVDGEDAVAMSVADLLQRLRGAPGTSVGVSVVRPSTGETLDVVIVRTSIVR